MLTKAVDIKAISITDDKWFSKDAQNGISIFTTEFVPVTLAGPDVRAEELEWSLRYSA